MSEHRVAISYSLFRADDRHEHGFGTYLSGVEMVLQAWSALGFPADIILAVEMEAMNRRQRTWLETLTHRYGALVIPREPARGREGALWRFDPIWQSHYDVVFTRDLDSLPTPNEVANMRAFLASQCTMHLYRSRLHYKLALAGLSGFRVAEIRNRYASPSAFWRSLDYSRYGAEEKRLAEVTSELGGDAIMETPHSCRVRGSEIPAREGLRALTPRISGYPYVAFAGKILSAGMIARMTARLRKLSV